MASIMRFCMAGTLIAAVTCHVQIGIYQHRVLRFKTEIAVQRAHQSTHGNHRRSDQHGTDRNLHGQQHVSDGNPPPSLAGSIPT